MTKAPENAPALLFLGGLQRRVFWGLRRRNNELNELTNFVDGEWGASKTKKYIWLRLQRNMFWPQTA